MAISKRQILYFADTGYERYGLVEKITEIVIACNSASADYSNTDEVRRIVPFGVSSVLKSNGPQKILVAGNSTFRSGISRKLFGQHGLPIRERIAQPLSIQIEKGGLSGEKLENDYNVF